jgi:hypothetical protein
MTIYELAFYASQINHASWRFSYGRRAIKRRLLQIEIEPYNLTLSEVRQFERDFKNHNALSLESIFQTKI